MLEIGTGAARLVEVVEGEEVAAPSPTWLAVAVARHLRELAD